MADDLRQFIYVMRPRRLDMLRVGPTAEELRVIEEHSGHLERLAAEGVVLIAGRTQNADETTFGIVILQASDEEAARSLVERDPFVKKGLMDATLFPFRIAYAAK